MSMNNNWPTTVEESVEECESKGNVMGKMANALFGSQPTNLTLVRFGDCPKCGDDCAEFWRDDNTGKEYVRCPYLMCDNWGKLTEVGE